MAGQSVGEKPQDVSAILSGAGRAFRTCLSLSHRDRCGLILHLASVLEEHLEDDAHRISGEIRKPIVQSESELHKCISLCKELAETSERYLKPSRVELGDGTRARIERSPLGVVVLVMPWNFPFWQVIRAAVPALLAGNGVALKHSPRAPGCAAALGERFSEAITRSQADPGLFALLPASDQGMEQILSHPAVQGVTVTGSDRAGSRIAALAGREIKKTVLELGGSDAFLVLADADVELAAAWGVAARLANCGQSCVSPKRLLADSRQHDRFVEELCANLDDIRVGDPFDRESDLGPLAGRDLLEKLVEQVSRSVELGARIQRGGRPVERLDCAYQPTVLLDVEPGMPVFDQEVFGPVLAVTRFDSTERAIELANASPYGLGASIWTADIPGALERYAGALQVGTVSVNRIVSSHPTLPFGGVKRSGYGRELGASGIREFTNEKVIVY